MKTQVSRRIPRHTASAVKVSVEVWITTALLSREHFPDRQEFSIAEIVARAEKEDLAGSLRPGVYTHVVQHCVANRPPSPARYRMLFETRPGFRCLYRPGLAYHFGRDGGKSLPDKEEIPPAYLALRDWYEQTYAHGSNSLSAGDALLALRGLGKEIWADEDPDEYVRRLREGWE